MMNVMRAIRKYHDDMKNAKKNSVTTGFKDSVFAGLLIVSALQIASGEGSLYLAHPSIGAINIYSLCIKINFSAADFTMANKKLDVLSNYFRV